MCGIIAALARRPVDELLISGLERLAYRGYDSVGMAFITQANQQVHCIKRPGKIAALAHAYRQNPVDAHIGIGHTRWATHGAPCTANAHPFIAQQKIAVVHNGVIENHANLRARLQAQGCQFNSASDSEVIPHLLHTDYATERHTTVENFRHSIMRTCQLLAGTYALGIIHQDFPDTLWGVRHGSPLILGIGINEWFLASDAHALSMLTQQLIYLKKDDLAEITPQGFTIYNHGEIVERDTIVLSDMVQPQTTLHNNSNDFAHYTKKEIHQQPDALWRTLTQNSGQITYPYHTQQRVDATPQSASYDSLTHPAQPIDDPLHQHLLTCTRQLFTTPQQSLLTKVTDIQIIACGSSYHAGLIAQRWFEQFTRLPTRVSLCSEYQQRVPLSNACSLVIAVSQSGENTDLLTALVHAQQHPHLTTLAVCNVVPSSLSQQAELTIPTHAGVETGVVATKSFSAQLAALLQLSLYLADLATGNTNHNSRIHTELTHLPSLVSHCLKLDNSIKTIASSLANAPQLLLLGQGILWPVAREGALGLKSVAYMHAEACAGGELKHGALALIQDNTPLIVLANQTQQQMHDANHVANHIACAAARGAKIYLLADDDMGIPNSQLYHYLKLPACSTALAPFTHSTVLQLLSYHLAERRGHHIDQPRNLAKIS